jgi:hypothetical protein
MQRRLDAEGRPAGLAARGPGDQHGPSVGTLPRARRADAGVSDAPSRRRHLYLWLDVKQVKMRDSGDVRSKTLVIAYAGRREVIDLDLAA